MLCSYFIVHFVSYIFFQSWMILYHFLNSKVCKLIFSWFCNVKVTTFDVSSVCGWTVREGRSCDSRGLEPPWNPRAVSLLIYQFLESLVSHWWSGTGQVITVHSLGLYNTKPWTCPNLNVFLFPNSWMIGRDLWPLTWEFTADIDKSYMGDRYLRHDHYF